MKNIITITILTALLCLAGCTAKAQNFLQSGWDQLTSTNAAGDLEALRGLKGNKDIFAATYVYNMTTNAALLVSYDKCYTRAKVPGAQSTDLLRGGLTLGSTIQPFKTWFGVTNFVVKVGAYEEAGTETQGQNTGQAVNIAGGYVDTQIHVYGVLYFHVGALYQNRTEKGYFGGNYAGIRAGVGASF